MTTLTARIDEGLVTEIRSHLRRTGNPDTPNVVDDYITQSIRRNLDGRKPEVRVAGIEYGPARWSTHDDEIVLTATGDGDGSVTIAVDGHGGFEKIHLPEPVVASLHRWLAP